MKPIKLLVVLFFISSCVRAQVSVKKGVVYEGSTAIAKVEGKIGMMKYANLDFLTSEGKSIVTVKEEVFDKTPFPPFKDFSWYTIKFSDSQKQLKIENATRCMNEKCIIELLAKKGILINGAVVANQDEAIAKFDYSATLQLDTAGKFTDEETQLAAQLLAIKPIGNTNNIWIGSDPEKYPNLFQIEQDSKVIAWLVKEEITTWAKEATIYKFYKQNPNNNPKDPSGKIYAAYFRVTTTDQKAFTYQDLKYHNRMSMRSIIGDKKNAEFELTKFLIDRGYL